MDDDVIKDIEDRVKEDLKKDILKELQSPETVRGSYGRQIPITKYEHVSSVDMKAAVTLILLALTCFVIGHFVLTGYNENWIQSFQIVMSILAPLDVACITYYMTKKKETEEKTRRENYEQLLGDVKEGLKEKEEEKVSL